MVLGSDATICYPTYWGLSEMEMPIDHLLSCSLMFASFGGMQNHGQSTFGVHQRTQGLDPYHPIPIELNFLSLQPSDLIDDSV